MEVDGRPITLSQFAAAMEQPGGLTVSDETLRCIAAAHERVVAAAAGQDPVYGLNTGLGGNLGHRIDSAEIAAFQYQIVAGRAVACGDPLPEPIGRGALLARILSAAKGYSGMSVEVFDHLCAVYRSGLSPVVPEFGSIGASDLTQNAHIAMAVLGEGEFWDDGAVAPAATGLERRGLLTPELRPKDGLALINHSGVTAALSAAALRRAQRGLLMMQNACLLSYEGYAANPQILDEAVNELRPAPGQAEAAAWFRKALQGSAPRPRRIQEALSFRCIAPVFGAASSALDRAVSVLEDEINGVPDSPVIFGDGQIQSTPNFHTSALALALEGVSLSLVSVANGSVQRMQRMMDPNLSGLPRYLAPRGARAAGFVPTQKTAASLLAEIRVGAVPAIADAAPVSDAVEDMAPMTPSAARKLDRQMKPFEYLAGLEAITAVQAIDLRDTPVLGRRTRDLHASLRGNIPFVEDDRPLSADIAAAVSLLRSEIGRQEEGAN